MKSDKHFDPQQVPIPETSKPIRLINQIDDKLDYIMEQLQSLQDKLKPVFSLIDAPILKAPPPDNIESCSPLIESLSATDDKVVQINRKVEEIISRLDL